MNKAKNWVVVLITLAGFIFAVSFSTLYAQTHIVGGTACACTLPIPILIPTFSSLGVFIGSLVYYLMFPKVEQKRIKIKENKEKYRSNIKTMLELLDKSEKKVIEKLVEKDGSMLQSTISKDMGKVKAFRTLENLRKRGIITKERYGKTNRIKLTEKFEWLTKR